MTHLGRWETLKDVSEERGVPISRGKYSKARSALYNLLLPYNSRATRTDKSLQIISFTQQRQNMYCLNARDIRLDVSGAPWIKSRL